MSTNATSREESTDTEHVDARLVLHDLSMDHTALNELPDFEPYCAAVEFATDALETAINRDNDYWLIAMRINTTDNYEWRTDLYDNVAELLDENTCAGAIDSSCIFTREMIANLERATDHPDMTEELAALLSTSQVKLEHEVRSGVNVRG